MELPTPDWEVRMRSSLVLLLVSGAVVSGGATLQPAAAATTPSQAQSKPARCEGSATAGDVRSSPASSRRIAPGKLSIAAGPNPARAGASAVVFGALLRGGVHGGPARGRRHVRLCGLTVTLWQRRPRQTRFEPAARTLTDARGRYRIDLPKGEVNTNREWFVSARLPSPSGSARRGGRSRGSRKGSADVVLRSRTVRERVHARITLTSSATFAVAGDRESFSGSVQPRQIGGRLLLQRWSGPRSTGQGGHRPLSSRWRTVATIDLSGGRRFSLSHLFSNAGRRRWRVVLPASRSDVLSRAPASRSAGRSRAGVSAGAPAGGPSAGLRPRNLESHSPAVTIEVAPLEGIHKIRHVVVIMQENRSFDTYFGTYPGADGIPPGVCVPDPASGGCVAPFHDSAALNHGGPHTASAVPADVASGAMNGFVAEAEKGRGCSGTNPNCSPCRQTSQASEGAAGQEHEGASGQEGEGGATQASEVTTARCIDSMGYHDAREIPNYWAYAHEFVLQDHMFSSVGSWSLPAHLYLVSEWSALCTEPFNPYSCHSAIEHPNNPPLSSTKPHYAWTDLTSLLHRQNVSWGYYVFKGQQPECAEDPRIVCVESKQEPGTPETAETPGIWDPLLWFTDVREDEQLGNIRSVGSFLTQAREGTLPSVSWVAPSRRVSEHPPALVSAGQEYVTGLIDAVMESPDWSSTAIFLSWDDWGGFYDHVPPPTVDALGYGLRVPGLLISPYAKHGYVDHQVLSHDAYAKFIENDFLGGERLNPATDGRPDPRPDVREESPVLGSLASELDFEQPPRPPLVLPVDPLPGPASTPP